MTHASPDCPVCGHHHFSTVVPMRVAVRVSALVYPQGVREASATLQEVPTDPTQAVLDAPAHTRCRCEQCGHEVPLSHIRQETPNHEITDFTLKEYS